MSNILTITQNDFEDTASTIYDQDYALREAARAVLLNDEGQVYLMHVTKHGYHKLPGGGIDDGESVSVALQRELLEEVGCKADIKDDLGTITEYRATAWKDKKYMKQISYCFIAEKRGEQQDSALEESEIEEGMIQVLADDIGTAIKLLEADDPDDIEGLYIQRRDLAFLKEAQKILTYKLVSSQES